MSFIRAAGDHFELDGKALILRGWALGSWMNFEHFMLGLPGTHSQIIDSFSQVYGADRAEQWLHSMLTNMVDDADLRYLKEIGINTVRIPFGYSWFMADEQPCAFREQGFRELDRVVRLCEKHGLYVILDLHSVPGSQNTDWHSDNLTGQSLFWKYRVFQDQAVWLWKQLAARYADDPWVVGYDVLNEPGYGLTGEQINGFYRRVIAGIREVDANHILFLEGTDFGRDFSVLERQEDPNIAYTVHFYPFVLEADILDPQLPDERRLEIFTGIFDRQLSAVARLGRPVWCGESGYEIQDGQEPFYAQLLLHNLSLCEDRGISWNLWTYKDARCMGIVIPRRESSWMALAREIGGRWSHHREERISMAMTREIGERFYEPLSDALAYDLDFQVRAVLHEVAVEQVLKPALRRIPWEVMKGYPEDFRFDRCDRRNIVVGNIRQFIRQKEEQKPC